MSLGCFDELTFIIMKCPGVSLIIFFNPQFLWSNIDICTPASLKLVFDIYIYIYMYVHIYILHYLTFKLSVLF